MNKVDLKYSSFVIYGLLLLSFAGCDSCRRKACIETTDCVFSKNPVSIVILEENGRRCCIVVDADEIAEKGITVDDIRAEALQVIDDVTTVAGWAAATAFAEMFFGDDVEAERSSLQSDDPNNGEESLTTEDVRSRLAHLSEISFCVKEQKKSMGNG